jgi:hypothetical protein
MTTSLQLSLANEFISSNKYKTLSTSSIEVHSNLWNILFSPLLEMTPQERERIFIEWDNTYVKAFTYAIKCDDTKYYATNYKNTTKNLDIEYRICLNFVMFLYH